MYKRQAENCVAVLSVYLFSGEQVISRNFTTFDVRAELESNQIELPVAAGISEGFDYRWTALNDEKLCLGGDGCVAYNVPVTGEPDDITITFEAGAKRVPVSYTHLNEPISIPRWHYLTPELEAFYDEAVRRIRRHDKNHLLFLEGPVFATDTRMFKKNFDPECSNWAISVHMYSFRPEKRSLFKFLEVSRRLNVPVWIGEGKSNNIDMCGFYEIAAREGLGFNLWCWNCLLYTSRCV